ncbi:MAG: glycosyltransferase family 39 protein [Candidatus Riflebacteria bacterium]|nr:glycosyltransferase family 39 protein [Candidatus Riflebacteria bacterium]
MLDKRRGVLIVASTLVFTFLALYLGFWGLDTASMEKLYRSSTWYFILLAFLLWLQKLATLAPSREELCNISKRHWPAAATALALVGLAISASPPDFRILADETNLLGMSQALYEEHSCHNITQALIYYHGIRRTISSVVDTRPAVYPFLTAATHSLTGYRPENAFVVNAIAGFLILLLCYLLIQHWFGRFWGMSAMLFLAAFPLFILYMTSAGFDTVNLLFALLLIGLSWAFIRQPQAEKAEILFLTLPLLAQTRYESALTVFCVIPLVLFRLPRSEYARLTWRTPLIPFLFLPAAWLRVITYTQKALQVEKIEQAFGLDHLWINLQHALPFFWGSEKAFGMVTPIAVAALIGLVWLMVDMLRRRDIDKSCFTFGVFVVTFFMLHALARFAFFWGNLKLQYTSRLGLIFLPLLVFLAIYAMRQLTRHIHLGRNWVLIGAVLLMIHGWPVAGQNLAVRDIFYYRELKTAREFLQQNYPNKKDYILVADLSNLYVPFNYSTVTPSWLAVNADETARSLKKRTWQRLLVLQKINIATNLPVHGSEVPARFTLNTLYESQLNTDKLLRISLYEPPAR